MSRARSGGSNSPANSRPRPAPVESPSTSGSRYVRCSSPHRTSPSEPIDVRSTGDVDAPLLRALAPEVLNVLVRRGADFATAEDAVQDAILKALTAWPHDPPRDPKGWLITTAWRAFIDLARSASARRSRELRAAAEPSPGEVQDTYDTLELYFLCAHPAL